jgi:hypothetical protein
MNHDDRRITLISRSKSAPDRPWLNSRDASRRLVFVESFGVIPFALARGVEESGQDVECVIIDGAPTANEYFHLLSTLPATYHGDVVFLMNESAFVSSSADGADSVLSVLCADEVPIYLETKMLTAPAEAMAA